MYRSKLVAKSIAFTALALPAVAQSTYIVDDNGPADFTDFPAAIAAAIPGDVLVVRAGAYSSISLSEGLTILCDDGVSAPALEVSNIPSDEIAVVSGLSAPRVALAHCTGTVILQHLMSLPPNSTSGTSSPVFDVLSCDDVRVYRSTITAPYDSNGSSSTPGPAAVHISSSRVELVRCAIIGGRMGYTVDDCAPVVGAGGDGVSIDDHSFVHVALSSVQGGDGSDVVNLFCTYSQPGNGGHAVEVSGQSTVVIAGTRTDVIRGGDRGKSTQSFNPNLSEPGRALFVHGGCSARYSGATLLLGHGSASLPWTVTTISAPIGAANQAIPADPTLERLGSGSPGTSVTLRVHAPFGSLAALDRGRDPVVQPNGGVIETLVASLAHFALGSVPATGVIEKTITISTADGLGARYMWQGGSEWLGVTTLTNSVPIIVR